MAKKRKTQIAILLLLYTTVTFAGGVYSWMMILYALLVPNVSIPLGPFIAIPALRALDGYVNELLEKHRINDRYWNT